MAKNDDLKTVVRDVSYDEMEKALQFIREHFQLTEAQRETDPTTGRAVTTQVRTNNWTKELEVIDSLLIAAQVWQANNVFRQLPLFELEEEQS